MTVRVYVPASMGSLAQFAEDGGIGPSPVHAHAVTAWLRESWADGNDEEWEYAALMAAADEAAAALTDEDQPRRVVLVAEVESAIEDPESTEVTVDSAIGMRLVEALHVDTTDVDLSVPASLGDLGWFAVQEIPELLA